MGRSKKLLILLAVLVTVCAATLVLTQYEEKQEQIKASDAVVLELPADSVTAVSWEYESGDGLAFTKTEDGWQYDEDAAFPVSETKIAQLLSHFEHFGVTFIIEDVEDLGQYGLDKPECTLHLTTAERTYDLKLGDFSKMDSQRYVDLGDGNVYLVADDPMDFVDSALSSMILHDDTPGFETVKDITFSGKENYTVVRDDESTASYNADDIYFTDLGGKTVPLDTAAVRSYLNTVTGLDLRDYVTYNATEADLQAYGLDAPLLSVTVRYSETDENGEARSDTCVFHLGENAAEKTAAEEAESAGETDIPAVTKYVRIGDSPIIYTLSDTDFAVLEAAGYNDLRHREIFPGDFEDVTQLDITLEGAEHSLVRSAGEEENETLWHYGDTEISPDALRSALEALSADSFTDEQPTGVEELAVTLRLENEAFPTVALSFFRYDGTHCLAVVDGEPTALVPRSDVITLVEAIQSIVLN